MSIFFLSHVSFILEGKFRNNGGGRAEEGVYTDSAIGTFLRIDAGDLIAFDDGAFRAFIDAASAVDAILCNFVRHQTPFTELYGKLLIVIYEKKLLFG